MTPSSALPTPSIANDPDRQIYIDGKCVCVYCGVDGRRCILAWHQLMIEHVIPLRCKAPERPKSPLNDRKNKVVACLSCNNVKRSWDKKYNDAHPDAPLAERVADALKSAKEYILKRYALIDADYEPMMKEIGPKAV